MKKVIKSILVIMVLAAVVTVATGAWFSSGATAEDNEITTGTLLIAMESTLDYDNNAANTFTSDALTETELADYMAYLVAEDNADGNRTNPNKFGAWVNAAPGDSTSRYLAIRAKGTVPMNYRVNANGEWTDGARFGLPGCPEGPGGPSTGDETLVYVGNVHQFAGNDCAGDVACEALRDSLESRGYTAVAGLVASDTGVATSVVTGRVDMADNTSALVQLGENEFALYRVDLSLDGPRTTNCYQDATYLYDVDAEAKQWNDTTSW